MVNISTKVTIDDENRLAYITLTEKKIFATVQVEDVLVDVDKNQQPVGVEILNIDATVPYSRIAAVFHSSEEHMDALEDALKGTKLRYEWNSPSDKTIRPLHWNWE